MSRLAFISDRDLEEAVNNLLLKANNALKNVEIKFDKNVIDPFSVVFEMAGFRISEEMWRTNEKARKAQKTLGNHVGAFHQTILGKVQGWINPGAGGSIDLVSSERMVIAEIKNKFNTVKGENLSDLYKKLENLVMPKNSMYKNYTAYYVEIIPKTPKRYDKPFTPSDSSVGKRKAENPLIRKIDGYSFYKFVTGIDDALLQLFQILPAVIESSQVGSGYKFHNIQFLNVFFNSAFGK